MQTNRQIDSFSVSRLVQLHFIVYKEYTVMSEKITMNNELVMVCKNGDAYVTLSLCCVKQLKKTTKIDYLLF
jgi:hypothetical protein